MHFSSAAALFALSSLSVTSAAPFANPQEDLFGRKVDYEIVNVGGDSSSAAPEIETVTETVKSVLTTPGAAPMPVTVTVTATPSSTPYSSATPTSTPYSHSPAPSSSSFLPSGTGFFHRGLNAAGDPYRFARSYGSSVSSVSTPVSATSLAVWEYDGWYSSATGTPVSSSVSVSTPLAGWYSSVPSLSLPTPSYSWSVPVSATPLVARGFGTPSISARSWSIPASPTALVARDFRNRA